MTRCRKRKGAEMATRKKGGAIPPRMPEYKREVCDNCALAEWAMAVQQHFDHAGNPIFMTCPHEEFFFMRGNKACKHFTRKKGG